SISRTVLIYSIFPVVKIETTTLYRKVNVPNLTVIITSFPELLFPVTQKHARSFWLRIRKAPPAAQSLQGRGRKRSEAQHKTGCRLWPGRRHMPLPATASSSPRHPPLFQDTGSAGGSHPVPRA